MLPVPSAKFGKIFLRIAAIELPAEAQVRAEMVHLLARHEDIGMFGQIGWYGRRPAFGARLQQRNPAFYSQYTNIKSPSARANPKATSNYN